MMNFSGGISICIDFYIARGIMKASKSVDSDKMGLLQRYRPWSISSGHSDLGFENAGCLDL